MCYWGEAPWAASYLSTAKNKQEVDIQSGSRHSACTCLFCAAAAAVRQCLRHDCASGGCGKAEPSMAAVRYVVYQSCIQLHHLWAHFVLSMPLHTRTVDWTLWAGSMQQCSHTLSCVLIPGLHSMQCHCGSSLCCTWWLLQTSYTLGPSPPTHTCIIGIKLHWAYTWIECQHEPPLCCTWWLLQTSYALIGLSECM